MKRLKLNFESGFFQNPYLLFSPFLIIYLLIVIRFHSDTNIGDEARYLFFAQNLLNGTYSPPFPNIDLTNGPGYPILLMPFVGLKWPLISITILNAFLYYFSILFIFKSLKQIATQKTTIIVSLFWACYYNPFEYFPLIYSETLAIFLVALLCFSLISAFNPNKLRSTNYYIFLSGIVFGYLVLTKFIFGYVLLLMTAGLFLLWVFKRNSISYRKGFIIMVIAFASNVPYLLYTFHLTGNLFYWGSAGGDSLYWMSTPYSNEYGNWQSVSDLKHFGPLKPDEIASKYDYLRSNHDKDFAYVSKFNKIEGDDILRSIAINNIVSNPLKFTQNCISNVGRILFNYPYSYSLQKPGTLLRLPPNGIISILALFCLIPTFTNWKKNIYPIRYLLFVTLLYLGGSVLGSAETRMFSIIAPVLLIWIAYNLERSIRFKFKWTEESIVNL